MSTQIKDLANIYRKFLPEKGWFVDVGAYDGVKYSNTKMLADNGWNGLCIEPLYHDRCMQAHKNNVIVEPCAVGATSGEVDIYIGEAISTTSENMYRLFQKKGWIGNVPKKTVRQETLESLLVKHNIPIGFELLDIDVEGSEWEVLGNFPIQKWMPQMVIIELHDNNPGYDNDFDADIIDYFDRFYRIVWKDLTNTIYVLK